MSKVQIVPDELGNVVRQSKNNSEYGYVRLQQDRVTYSNGGWLKRSNVSTLLHGKVEDFDAIGIKDQSELTGKIIIKEQTTPFSNNDPDRDLKYAGDTGIICCAHGEPIYRKTFFVADLEAEDVFVAHTNSDAIKEANGTSTKADANEAIDKVIAEKEEDESDPNQVDLEDAIAAEESEETMEEVDEVEADFEL